MFPRYLFLVFFFVKEKNWTKSPFGDFSKIQILAPQKPDDLNKYLVKFLLLKFYFNILYPTIKGQKQLHKKLQNCEGGTILD